MIADFKLNRSIIQYPMNRGSPICLGPQSPIIWSHNGMHLVKKKSQRSFALKALAPVCGMSNINFVYLNSNESI